MHNPDILPPHPRLPSALAADPKGRILIVPHEALHAREDRVVAAHAAVLPGEPERAALAEDDVARHDELGLGFFGAEALAGALFGAVGAALGGVGGGAGVGRVGGGGEESEGGEGEAVEGEEEGGGGGGEGGEGGEGVEAWLEHCVSC